MHDELVERDEAGHRARERHTARGGLTLPRRAVAPRLGQQAEIAGDAFPPTVLEVRRRRRRRRLARARLLAGDRGEGLCKGSDVVDEVADSHVGTRGAQFELSLGNGADQTGHAGGGGSDVDHR